MKTDLATWKRRNLTALTLGWAGIALLVFGLAIGIFFWMVSTPLKLLERISK